MPFSKLAIGAFASLFLSASASSALVTREIPFPHLVPIEKRQAAGTKYECHSNCGGAIMGAEGDYCDSADWTELYDACMECAIFHDIWQHYGEGVTGAAEACGLVGEPMSEASAVETSVVASVAEATSVVTSAVVEETATIVAATEPTLEVSSTHAEPSVTGSWAGNVTSLVPSVTGGANASQSGEPEAFEGSAHALVAPLVSIFGFLMVPLMV